MTKATENTHWPIYVLLKTSYTIPSKRHHDDIYDINDIVAYMHLKTPRLVWKLLLAALPYRRILLQRQYVELTPLTSALFSTMIGHSILKQKFVTAALLAGYILLNTHKKMDKVYHRERGGHV